MSSFWSDASPITKGMIVVGILILVLSLAADYVGIGGGSMGFGPRQIVGTIVGIVVADRLADPARGDAADPPRRATAARGCAPAGPRRSGLRAT